MYYEPESGSVSTRSGALRVLIVDDESDAVRTLLAILRLEGIDARGLIQAQHALAAVRDFNPDAVIIDIHLGSMSGWQIARDIREETTPKRPLLIGLSGQFKQAADKILAELAGFNYYLIKPCDPNVLLTLLEKTQWSQRVGDGTHGART